MKIVEIINELQSRGGAEVFFSTLCLEFTKQKDTELVLISLFDQIHPSFLELFKKNNIRFYTCHKNRGIDIKAAFLLRKILLKEKPNIVHFHLSCLPTYYLGFGSRKRQWILCQTFHSIPGSTSKGFAEFIRKKFIKKNRIFFIGISDKITSLAIKTYPNIQCTTIFNGIDLKNIVTSSTKKEFDLIIVASFTKPKNHHLLFDTLVSANVCKKVSLLCVGDGPLKQDYVNYVQENNIEYIKIIGPVNDVYPYLQRSKIFVLSSVREGNPISMIEAMNCGLPVVAPSVGGIPDVLDHMKGGLIYQSNNKDELLFAIEHLLEHPELIKEFGDYNKEKSKCFNIGFCCKQYIDFFNKIMDKERF